MPRRWSPSCSSPSGFTAAPQSWSEVVHTRLATLPIAEVVHGALLTYDLPDLAATLAAKLKPEARTKEKP